MLSQKLFSGASVGRDFSRKHPKKPLLDWKSSVVYELVCKLLLFFFGLLNLELSCHSLY